MVQCVNNSRYSLQQQSILAALVIIILKLETIMITEALVTNFYQSVPTIIDNQVYYEYRYWIEDVESGVVSEKWESRLGDYVKGRYSFLQPDGLIRTVHYEVDGPSGFRSIVNTDQPGTNYLSRQQFLESQKN